MAGSGKLKASLMLTYDYLRLYVNAFAYQATISRALSFRRDSQHNPNRPMPLINASAPDARFIYEALDAAKSLLTTLNEFVPAETLRYMPSSYYLFIVYSAVFLYKARSTTTMTEEERSNVREMITLTTERLEKASLGTNHMGSRYSRLLRMLWRKSPRKAREQQRTTGSLNGISNAAPPPFNQFGHLPMNNMSMNNQFPQAQSGTFSWLDLPATWNFVTQNQNSSDGETEAGMLLGDGLSPFDADLGMMTTDFSVLEGDNPNLVF
jgi:hypothetical protein